MNLSSIQSALVGPTTTQKDALQAWRERILSAILIGATMLGTAAYSTSMLSVVRDRQWDLATIYTVAYGWVLGVTLVRRLPYIVRAGSTLFIIYALGLVGLLESGLSGDGRVFLLTFPVITSILLGLNAGLGALALSLGSLATVGWLMSSGRLELPPISTLANSGDLMSWTTGSAAFLLLGTIATVSLAMLVRGLETSLKKERTLITALEQERTQLEQRVVERTADLERRSSYLAASAEVGRAIASILDTGQLVQQVVELIREQFGLYYVGLFLLDESGEWAILQAGSGEAGQKMLARGHRIKVGAGMIGWSIAHAQARVALQAGEDTVRLATVELPDTRSEAALLLRSRGRIIGALTVQSAQPGAFDEATVGVLQTMADQVAVTLDNARLFTESQIALETTRRAYGELSRRAWVELLRVQPNLGYRSDGRSAVSTLAARQPEIEKAIQEKRTVQASAEAKLSLAVPIRLGDNTIGVLSTYKPREAGGWTHDETSLMEELASQLALALDSARLYGETQRRAAREQLTSQVTARMRESLDVDRVLQTAVRQVGQALGAHEVNIRLITAEKEEQP